MKRWTEYEENKLRELYCTDKTVLQIANELGRPLRTVYVKAHKLGLPKKKNPKTIELDMEQIIWLRSSYPYIRTEICALRLGISYRSVIRLARKYKLEKTAEFMADCQSYAAEKAKESHLANGTYPPKGIVNENLKKGEAFRFKSGHAGKNKS